MALQGREIKHPFAHPYRFSSGIQQTGLLLTGSELHRHSLFFQWVRQVMLLFDNAESIALLHCIAAGRQIFSV